MSPNGIWVKQNTFIWVIESLWLIAKLISWTFLQSNWLKWKLQPCILPQGNICVIDWIAVIESLIKDSGLKSGISVLIIENKRS